MISRIHRHAPLSVSRPLLRIFIYILYIHRNRGYRSWSPHNAFRGPVRLTRERFVIMRLSPGEACPTHDPSGPSPPQTSAWARVSVCEPNTPCRRRRRRRRTIGIGRPRDRVKRLGVKLRRLSRPRNNNSYRNSSNNSLHSCYKPFFFLLLHCCCCCCRRPSKSTYIIFICARTSFASPLA